VANNSVAENKEQQGTKFKLAVDWAVEESTKNHGGHCGVCAWRPWEHNSPKQAANSLTKHIRSKHRDTIVDLYDREILDLSTLRPAPPSLSEDELLAAAGLTDVQELDHFDYLAIPEDIRTRMDVDGSVPRWVRRGRVDHFTAQGARVVNLNNGKGGTRQGSTEDNILKTNELVCVELPHELALRRKQQKDSRINDQLNARAEEMRTTRDEHEKRTYDYLRSERNLDHQQAKQVTQALTTRRTREEERSGVTIGNRHGQSEY
jgi:hypothetical protein